MMPMSWPPPVDRDCDVHEVLFQCLALPDGEPVGLRHGLLDFLAVEVVVHGLVRVSRVAEDGAIGVNDGHAQVGLLVELLQRRVEPGYVPTVELVLQ